MTVSVVVPCFNGEAYLGEALRSVLVQTHRDLEVMVVDDGSTDGSMAVARSIRDPRIRVVTQSNAGVAAARNRGVAETSGEWIAFLDQDDAWLPTKPERQLEVLRRSPEIGFVYSDGFLIDGEGSVVARWSDRFPLCRGQVFERLLVAGAAHISTVMMRRSTFEAVGGFRSRYRFIEDLALLLDIAAGHRVEVIDAPLANCRIHHLSTSRRLGLEVAVDEVVALCDEWVARGGARQRAITRALAHYLYIAGKTAFYQGRVDLAVRYLGESSARHWRPSTRLFWVAVRRCPRMLLGTRRLVKRLRNQAGPAPGPFAEGEAPPRPAR